MVGREAYIFRFVPELFIGNGCMDRTFVAGGDIKNGEEGLTFGSVPVVCLPAALVPHTIDIYGRGIVIGLAVVGAVITFLHQVFGIEADRFRFLIPAAHLLISVGTGMNSCDNGISSGSADRGIGIGIGIEKSFGCQLIQVRGACKFIPIASQQGTVILTGDPEDIGQAAFLSGKAKSHKSNKNNGNKSVSFLHFHGICRIQFRMNLVLISAKGQSACLILVLIMKQFNFADSYNMKKFLTLILLSFICMQTVHAQGDSVAYESRSFQFTFLFPPLSTNWINNVQIVNDVSLNLLVGVSGGVNAFELGGLINFGKYYMRGVQLAGFGNNVGGSVKGAQLAGYFNFGGTSINGFQ